MALGSLGKLFVEIGADTSGLKKGLDGAESQLDAFSGKVKKTGAAIGKGMSSAGKGLTKGVTLPLVAVGAGFMTLSGKAADFESGMNRVFTLLPGITDKAMGEMEDDLLAFSREMGILPSEAVPALYQALSAGVPPDNVFEFMRTAAKASIGGVADLETTVDGLTSVVNAYGKGVLSAAEASDIMAMAATKGKTDLGPMSDALYNVIPTASALGVSFEDVAAALATITAAGTPTSVATTQLRSLFSELSKEGTKTSDAFKEVAGVGFKEFISQGHNLQDALGIMADATTKTTSNAGEMGTKISKAEEKLAKYKDQLVVARLRQSEFSDSTKESTKVAAEQKIGKLTENIAELEGFLSTASVTSSTTTKSLSDMFGSVEAGNAALLLAGSGAESFASNVDAFGDSSGAADEKFKTMSKSAEQSMNLLKAEFSATMIEIGNEFIPILKDDLLPIFRDDIAPLLKDVVVPAIKGLANAFSAMSPGMKKVVLAGVAIAAALGPVLMVLGPLITAATALAPVITAVGAVIGGVALGPLVLIVAAIAAVVYAFTHWDEIVTIVRNVIGKVSSFIGNLDRKFKDAGKALMIALGNGILSGISSAVNAVKSAASKVMEFLPFSDAKRGPLSNITASGAALMTTFQKGIASSNVDLSSTVDHIMPQTIAAARPAAPAAASSNVSNTSSVSMGDVSLSNDFDFMALMAQIDRYQATKRTQRGVV